MKGTSELWRYARIVVAVVATVVLTLAGAELFVFDGVGDWWNVLTQAIGFSLGALISANIAGRDARLAVGIGVLLTAAILTGGALLFSPWIQGVAGVAILLDVALALTLAARVEKRYRSRVDQSRSEAERVEP